MIAIADKLKFIQTVKNFLATKGIQEIYCSVLNHEVEPQLHVEPIFLGKHALPTSPEFALKKFICANKFDVYNIGSVFRHEIPSKLHKNEFLMLEYYRLGFDYLLLAKEVIDLVQLFVSKKAKFVSLASLFNEHLDVNIHVADIKSLQSVATHHNLRLLALDNISAWMDYLFSHLILPKLSGITCIYGFLPCQAALAKVENQIAKRFEVFIEDVEIANGYQEENSTTILRRRFEQQNALRIKNKLQPVMIDEEFLQVMHELPHCAGVAIGLERILQIQYVLKDINQASLIF